MKALGTLPQEICAVIIEAIAASDLSAAFLGKENEYTAGEAIMRATALGPACAARAALVARPLTPSLAPCAASSVGLPQSPKATSSLKTSRPLNY
jgi:hypothetical protein